MSSEFGDSKKRLGVILQSLDEQNELFSSGCFSGEFSSCVGDVGDSFLSCGRYLENGVDVLCSSVDDFACDAVLIGDIVVEMNRSVREFASNMLLLGECVGRIDSCVPQTFTGGFSASGVVEDVGYSGYDTSREEDMIFKTLVDTGRIGSVFDGCVTGFSVVEDIQARQSELDNLYNIITGGHGYTLDNSYDNSSNGGFGINLEMVEFSELDKLVLHSVDGVAYELENVSESGASCVSVLENSSTAVQAFSNVLADCINDIGGFYSSVSTGFDDFSISGTDGDGVEQNFNGYNSWSSAISAVPTGDFTFRGFKYGSAELEDYFDDVMVTLDYQSVASYCDHDIYQEEIAQSTSSAAKSLAITQEDLKYMRDLAEMEVINRFTTAEIKVDMGGITNNVSSNVDVDGIIDYMASGVHSAMEASANGVW